MFGDSIMKRYLVKSIRDLAVLVVSKDSQDNLIAADEKFKLFAKDNSTIFVSNYYEFLLKTVNDSTILNSHPWACELNNTISVIPSNIRVLNKPQRELTSRVLKVIDNTSTIDPFYLSTGPSISVIVWKCTGEFLNELELDCKGRIDILKQTKQAVVMGAEIKTSESAIGAAKKN